VTTGGTSVIFVGMTTRRDFKAMEQRRFRALRLLEKGFPQAEVARRTKVSRQSVLRWNRQRIEGGQDALRAAGRAGRKPRLEPDQERELVNLLVAGPEAAGFATPLWTLERVAKVIRRQFGFACHATTALRILRDRLGWSCQKPVGRALERDEAALATWKRKTWPALKKRLSPKAARSSSSTKAA
jgi:transposase